MNLISWIFKEKMKNENVAVKNPLESLRIAMVRNDAPTPVVVGGLVTLRMPFYARLAPGESLRTKLGVTFDRSCCVHPHRRLQETYPALKVLIPDFVIKSGEEPELQAVNEGGSVVVLEVGDQVLDLAFLPDVQLVDA